MSFNKAYLEMIIAQDCGDALAVDAFNMLMGGGEL